MSPKLYMLPPSPPVRAVLCTANALGVDLELVTVNLREGDHLTPEYTKLNPQRTIPTMVDGDKVLWDSHVINTYLVGKYAKNDSLYPKDLYQRAQVDQRMHFDSSIIFPLTLQIARPIVFDGVKTIPESVIPKVKEAYGYLEAFLKNQEWLAGDKVTLADIQCISTVSSLDFFVPVEESVFPNVKKWMKRCEKFSWYEPNRVGLNEFKEMITTIRNS